MNEKEKTATPEIAMLRFTLNSLGECMRLALTEIDIAHEQLDQLEKAAITNSKPISK